MQWRLLQNIDKKKRKRGREKSKLSSASIVVFTICRGVQRMILAGEGSIEVKEGIEKGKGEVGRTWIGFNGCLCWKTVWIEGHISM